MSDFEGFAKIARYSREAIITEKIDGTNAQILITPDGDFFTGSRNRWITPEDDNFGFSRWAHEHKDELLGLGTGRHFGEWYGAGIQRRYGLSEKRWALFNVGRWRDESGDTASDLPTCCSVVPIVTHGLFCSELVTEAMNKLKSDGSIAAPGFMQPEGIIIFHTAGRHLFKKTFEKDEGKGEA